MWEGIFSLISRIIMNVRLNESDVSVVFRFRCWVINVLMIGVSVLFNVLML